MPQVVVFKLCNILMFRSLNEKLILKCKVYLQWGTKTDKLLFSPQSEGFHKIQQPRRNHGLSMRDVHHVMMETDSLRIYFCFCTRFTDSASANTAKILPMDCSFDNAIVIL